MEQNLSILTARQRQICELRGQKLTFQKIGAQLGISASSARKTYQLALRRLRQQWAQEVQDALDRQPADFAVTCGELGLICSGLRLLCRDMHRRLRRWRAVSSGPGRGCTAPDRRSSRGKRRQRRTKTRNNRLFFRFSRKKPCLLLAFMVQYSPVKS